MEPSCPVKFGQMDCSASCFSKQELETAADIPIPRSAEPFDPDVADDICQKPELDTGQKHQLDERRTSDVQVWKEATTEKKTGLVETAGSRADVEQPSGLRDSEQPSGLRDKDQRDSESVLGASDDLSLGVEELLQQGRFAEACGRMNGENAEAWANRLQRAEKVSEEYMEALSLLTTFDKHTFLACGQSPSFKDGCWACSVANGCFFIRSEYIYNNELVDVVGGLLELSDQNETQRESVSHNPSSGKEVFELSNIAGNPIDTVWQTIVKDPASNLAVDDIMVVTTVDLLSNELAEGLLVMFRPPSHDFEVPPPRPKHERNKDVTVSFLLKPLRRNDGGTCVRAMCLMVVQLPRWMPLWIPRWAPTRLLSAAISRLTDSDFRDKHRFITSSALLQKSIGHGVRAAFYRKLQRRLEAFMRVSSASATPSIESRFSCVVRSSGEVRNWSSEGSDCSPVDWVSERASIDSAGRSPSFTVLPSFWLISFTQGFLRPNISYVLMNFFARSYTKLDPHQIQCESTPWESYCLSAVNQAFAWIIFLSAVACVVHVFVTPLLWDLSSSYGRRGVLMVCTALSSVAPIVMAIAVCFNLNIYFIIAVIPLTEIPLSVVILAIVGDSLDDDSKRANYFGNVLAAGELFLLVGLCVSLLFSLKNVFVIIAGATLCNSAYIFCFRESLPLGVRTSLGIQFMPAQAAFNVFQRNIPLRRLVCCLLTANSCIAGMLTVLAPFLQKYFNCTSRDYTRALICQKVSMVLWLICGQRMLILAIGEKKVLAVSFISTVLFAISMALAFTTLQTFLACALFVGPFALAFPIILAQMRQLVGEHEWSHVYHALAVGVCLSDGAGSLFFGSLFQMLDRSDMKTTASVFVFDTGGVCMILVLVALMTLLPSVGKRDSLKSGLLQNLDLLEVDRGVPRICQEFGFVPYGFRANCFSLARPHL